jgi:excisionase family DNA binding protein
MQNQQIYMLSEEGIKVLVEQITGNILKNLNTSNSSVQDVFMNIDETAKLINLAKSSVYGLVHQNKIPYHKKGKRLYFLKSEILSWLKSGKHQTQSEIEEKANVYIIKNKLF